MSYTLQAQTALAERSALVEQVRAVQADSNLSDAAKRSKIEALNTDIQAKTEEARSFVEQAEREAEVRELGSRLSFGVPGGGQVGEVRENLPLPEGRGFGDLPGGKPATATEFGEYARSLIYEGRAASEGTDAAGGFIVPTKYASGVLDLARNQAQVVNAGAQVVPLGSDDVRLAKVSGDPTAGWRSEAGAIAASDITFGEVQFKAKSLAVLVKASFELVEDAPNFGAVLQHSLAEAFAVKLDSAGLYGSGVDPEPKGLKNVSGVTITPMGTNGATPTNWDPFIAAVRDVRSANYTPSGLILAERTEATLASLKDTTGQYLPPPQYLKDVPRYSTGNVPVDLTVGTSTNCSDVFVGDFSQLMVGIRTSFGLKVLRERFADVGQVGFIGWLRADVQVARTDAFQIVSGVRP